MDIIGHQKIIEYLNQCLSRKQIAHGYLFSGPEHSGKTAVALYFIQTLLCSSPQKKGNKLIPCQECLSCQKIKKNIHPDFLYLKGEEKSSIGIDDMRRVKNFFALRPFIGKHKVALITQAEKLTEQAINSSLKLLEETAKGGIIILTTADIKHFPSTFLSRLQIFRFHLPSKKEILSWLKKNYPHSPLKAEELLFFSFFQPGLINYFLEHNAEFSSFKKDLKEAIECLSSSDFQKLSTFINNQKEPSSRLDLLLLAIHFLIIKQFDKQKLPKSIKISSKEFSSEELFSQSLKILQSKFYLEKNVNPNLVLPSLLMGGLSPELDR